MYVMTSYSGFPKILQASHQAFQKNQAAVHRQFWLQDSQRDEGRGRAEMRIKRSINIMAQD